MTGNGNRSAREIVDAGRSAVAEGLDIVERTHAEGNFTGSTDDGPKMRAWKQRAPTIEATPSRISEMLISLIGYIVSAERAGRWAWAGMGLVRLREHYEGRDPRDLPPDEQSWLAFATKHVPLPPERVGELIGRMVNHGGALRCTRCGTSTVCRCGCGRPYVGAHRWSMPAEEMSAKGRPSALDRALAALAASPEKSNRALAAEIGVGLETVRRARQRIKETGGDGSPDGSPDRRLGRDGRSYPVV